MRVFIIKTVIVFVMLNMTFFTGIQIYKYSLLSIKTYERRADLVSYNRVLEKVLKYDEKQRDDVIEAKIFHEATGR